MCVNTLRTNYLGTRMQSKVYDVYSNSVIYTIYLGKKAGKHHNPNWFIRQNRKILRAFSEVLLRAKNVVEYSHKYC